MLDERKVKVEFRRGGKVWEDFSLEVSEDENDGSFMGCSINFSGVASFMACNENETLFFSRDKDTQEEKRFKKSDLSRLTVKLKPIGCAFTLVRDEKGNFKMVPTRFMPDEILVGLYPDPYQRAVLRLEGWALDYLDGSFFIGSQTGQLYMKTEDKVYSLAYLYDGNDGEDRALDYMRADGFDMSMTPFFLFEPPIYNDVRAIDEIEYEEIGSLLELGPVARVNDNVRELLCRLLTDEEAEAFIERD